MKESDPWQENSLEGYLLLQASKLSFTNLQEQSMKKVISFVLLLACGCLSIVHIR